MSCYLRHPGGDMEVPGVIPADKEERRRVDLAMWEKMARLMPGAGKCGRKSQKGFAEPAGKQELAGAPAPKD